VTNQYCNGSTTDLRVSANSLSTKDVMAIKIDLPTVRSARVDAVNLKMFVFCRESSAPAVAPSANGITMPALITATNLTTADAKEIPIASITLKSARIAAKESDPSQRLPQKLHMFLIRNVKMTEKENVNLNVVPMNENVNVTATLQEEVCYY
jgi:hypothetical protein